MEHAAAAFVYHIFIFMAAQLLLYPNEFREMHTSKERRHRAEPAEAGNEVDKKILLE